VTGLLRWLYAGSGLRALLPMRVRFALHRYWARVARTIGYPLSSPQRPRPALSRRRRRMRLSHVLLACDTNPAYLGFWPLARQAWQEIVGIAPVLVLVADEDELIEASLPGTVVRFAPLPDVHRTFQAQCIRLLYPALLETEGAVIISDVDLLPIRPSYFHAPVAALDERFFVVYRDVLLPRGEVVIPYNAARPETWGEIFGIGDLADVRARLGEWARGVDYEGVRGGSGWYTDQLTLYRKLFEWDRRTGRAWILDDDICGYRRLYRRELESRGKVTPELARGLRSRRYSDCDWVIPFGVHEALNRELLDLSLPGSAS
jgi:hypothetical protein